MQENLGKNYVWGVFRVETGIGDGIRDCKSLG